ncbi:Short-chain dehydrogenase/reductase, conserved site,NAD(P)-binding domain,Short-chain [Cinara cedri]|uniref:Short-chain dehydrogenase/reductase, conserved site,NAD(P)-binding domain,Short-chain n=1 Tax=Cinara cedri TaxID=506608 RepID=A0A5E4M7U5_9HEMI|nr:Short-chain dehydrogenase/reductase, conserved site,NAD(P)-binding domain,Short-chain [Cinara cedri]
MFGSIYKLSTKLSNRCVTKTLSRSITQQRASMEEYFKGKRFIVTGASAGMGKVIAGRLIALDAHVFAVGRDVERLPDADNLKLTKASVDVGEWETAYNEVLAMGPVHGLVNNAGVAHIESFLETTKKGWDDTLNINARGMVRISQAVAKNMIDAKIRGSIVNISSTISEKAIPDHVAYCASKGAVNQITRTMAIELGTYGIRTNNVNPTVVLTKMGKKAWSDPKKSEPILNRIPLGRFAEPSDIADAVIFLLSDYSQMVNGLNLYVDGGFMSG